MESCYIDGVFEFNNNKYIVKLSSTEYRLRYKYVSRMDKILCIYDNNNLQFYDENIKCITKEVKLHEV